VRKDLFERLIPFEPVRFLRFCGSGKGGAVYRKSQESIHCFNGSIKTKGYYMVPGNSMYADFTVVITFSHINVFYERLMCTHLSPGGVRDLPRQVFIFSRRVFDPAAAGKDSWSFFIN